jgi:hypothetical protein
MERSAIRVRWRGVIAESRITLRFIRATLGASCGNYWNRLMTDNEGKKIRTALEALVKATQQWCPVSVDHAGEPWLDSGAFSANAAVMRVLADHGLLTINVEVGRRIIAK